VLTIEQVDMNIKIDKDIKRGLEEFADRIGLSVSAIFNAMAKKVVSEQRITFEVLNYPNDETIEAIEESRSLNGMSAAFNSFDELMEDLNADD